MTRTREPDVADAASPLGRAVRALPAALFVIVFVADLVSPTQFQANTVLTLVPMTAAGLGSLRSTVCYAVLCTISFFLLDTVLAPAPDGHDWAGLVVVALGGAIAVPTALLRTRLQDRVARLGDVVQEVQRAILPPAPPVVGGIAVDRCYQAAERDAEVGGDVYDIIATPYGTRAFIADVQGKGLTAVGAGAALVGTFREAAFHELDLRDVGRRMGNQLERFGRDRVLAGGPDMDWFATGLIATLDADGRVEIVNHGHEAPAVIGPDGVRWIEVDPTLPLGLAGLAPEARAPEPVHFRLGPSDRLFLYTDGTTEARDHDGRFFPLRAWMDRHADARRPPAALLTDLRNALLAHVGGRLTDDAALMILRVAEPAERTTRDG
ncbi:PP2C family protein-serine/threonine phosphatase [Streptomyces sp. SID3343]|uniref:PP2C family protein-serine/threonine phosphatase n=1 Tax=Streptomyces sp. SID3343 TaxID=2690260 RepID=UPI0013703A62|nr:PP2C family protein-serine/threonine phosphatase [Streptomyces sp. SID3343]MYV99863.1 SpoIIE family protein phosphatase [Streptomyces sp. SID3343]